MNKRFWGRHLWRRDTARCGLQFENRGNPCPFGREWRTTWRWSPQVRKRVLTLEIRSRRKSPRSFVSVNRARRRSGRSEPETVIGEYWLLAGRSCPDLSRVKPRTHAIFSGGVSRGGRNSSRPPHIRGPMRGLASLLRSFPLLQRVMRLLPSDYGAGVPPVPIPNTEVKPCRADGTAA